MSLPVLQDLKYAARAIGRNPLFAAVAIATLAVGIGLNTSVFSIVNAMLFRPLQVERAGDLVWVTSASLRPDGPRGNMTYPDVVDLRDLRVLADLTAYSYVPANLAYGGEAARLEGQVAELTNVMSRTNVGVQLADPLGMLLSVVILAAITLLAAFLPARRATRVDPLVALRAE